MTGKRGTLFWSAIAVAAVSAATPAAADSYRFVAKDKERSAIFLNEDSVVQDGDTRTFDLVSVDGHYINEPQSKDSYFLMRLALNCRTHTMRILGIHFYGPDGSQLAGKDSASEDGPVEAGTIEEDFFQVVCLAGGPKPVRVQAETPFKLAQWVRDAVNSK